MAKPDLTAFLSDPAFQGDRDLFNGVIDARLKFHAEEAAKRAKDHAPVSFWDELFGGAKPPESK